MKKPSIEEIRKIEQELMIPSQLQLPTVKNIIPRDANGRPIVKLEEIEKIVVRTPTEQDYNILMRVYDCAGWKWSHGHSPLVWTPPKEDFKFDKIYFDIKNPFRYGTRYFSSYAVFMPEQFYKEEKISREVLIEINKYFEQRKK